MTVLEMVIAMAIMSIVFTAVVPLFASIRNSWATRQADAETVQNARVLTDHVYQSLLKAVKVMDVSPPSEKAGYVEFQSSDEKVYRYEVGNDGYVLFGPPDHPAALAGPVTGLQFTCYDGNDFTTATTDVASIRFIRLQAAFAGGTPIGRGRSFATSVYLRTGRPEEDAERNPVDPGVAVDDEVDWGGWGTVIDSYRSSQGPYSSLSPGAEAVVCVNATAKNKIALWTQTKLRGDAYVGPGGNPDTGIDVSGDAEITGVRGALTEAMALPALSAPTGGPFGGSGEGHVTIENETVVVNSDRHFKKLQIWRGGKLQVQGDVTMLLKGKLDVGEDGEIEILAGSTLRLYLAAQADLWGAARVNVSGADPTKLRIYVVGNKQFQVDQQARIYAVIQNPEGEVRIWDDAEVFGKVQARRLYGGGKLHVDLDCDFDLGVD